MQRKFLSIVLSLLLAIIMTSCQGKSNDIPKDTVVLQKEVVSEVSMKEFLHNINVRKAFSYAIDKSYIENTLLGASAIESNFIVNKEFCYDENNKDFRTKYPDGWNNYDVKKAQEYWQKAKDELGFDTFSVNFLTFDTEVRQKVSEYVQSQLMQNLDGLKIVMNVQPFKNKLKMATDGDFDIDFYSWGADYADPMTFLDLFVSDASINSAKYSNKEFDTLVKSAKSGELAKDSKKRWEALQDAEKILIGDDASIIPLYQDKVSYLQKNEVTGLMYRSLPPYFCFRYAKTDNEINGEHLIRMTSSSDIPSLNSTLSADSVSFDVLAATIDTLTDVDKDNNLLFRAAKSVDVSDDNLVYTFHLRENAIWQNGDPVTANDFVFGWKKLADPKNAGTYAFILETAAVKNASEVIKGEKDLDELGVKAIDDYTFEVTLENPVPFFLKLISFNSFSPVNEKFYNEHKDDFGTSIETTLCNGAYLIDDWTIGYGYTLKKNPNYWDKDNVLNDGVTFRIVKDVSSKVNLYENNQIDWVQLEGEYADSYSDRDDCYSISAARNNYIRFNLK